MVKFNLVSTNSVCRPIFCKISRAWVEFLLLKSSDIDDKHFLKSLWNKSWISNRVGYSPERRRVHSQPVGHVFQLPVHLPYKLLTPIACFTALWGHFLLQRWCCSLWSCLNPTDENLQQGALSFLLPALTKPHFHLHFSNSLQHMLNIKVMQDLSLWLKIRHAFKCCVELGPQWRWLLDQHAMTSAELIRTQPFVPFYFPPKAIVYSLCLVTEV